MPRQRLGVALLIPPPAAAQIDTLRAAVGDGARERIPAHLTLVPPVNVRVDDLDAAVARLRDAASACRPFTLTLGPPATFLPENPVLYLAVAGGPDALRLLHALRDAVFQPPLERPLTWPFVPHVTLCDEMDPDAIQGALVALSSFTVDVTFTAVHLLREEGRVWRPIADVAFGPPAVIGRGAGPMELEITEGERLDPTAATWSAQQWVRYDEEQYGANAWRESSLALVARRDGAVVGTVTGWTNGGVAHLSELMVDAGARGEGIGSHLVAAFEAAARRRGAHRLGLRTERGGPAHGFYERHGWRVEAVIPRWIHGRDVVQMGKTLQ